MPDPQNPQTLNRYAYALNNLLRYTDPSGQTSEGCYYCGSGSDQNSRFDFGLPDFNSQTSSFHQESSFNFSTVNTSSPSYSANNYNRPSSPYSDLGTRRIFGDSFSFFDEEGNVPFVGPSGQGNPSSFTLSVFVDAVSILFAPVGLARGIAEAVNGMLVSDKAPLNSFEIGLGLATFGKGRGALGAFRFLDKSLAGGITFRRGQLQHAFDRGHAKDFGILGNANNRTLSEFSSAVQRHVDSVNSLAIQGAFRGTPVTHFVDPTTRLNVTRDASGNFLTGWKLNPKQLESVLTNGKLGGG